MRFFFVFLLLYVCVCVTVCVCVVVCVLGLPFPRLDALEVAGFTVWAYEPVDDPSEAGPTHGLCSVMCFLGRVVVQFSLSIGSHNAIDLPILPGLHRSGLSFSTIACHTGYYERFTFWHLGKCRRIFLL